MRSTQIVCDECGAVKKEANHWWQAQIDRLVVLAPIELALIPADGAVNLDLCSESCVQKTVSKYMRGEFKP
jgi:hypothetical protein